MPGLTNVPTVVVEIGLASSASVAIASTSWTDVSAEVRSCSITRGRSTEFDQFQAGTMTIVLDNRDRKFDPNYAAGPYFGNLLPLRRIRVKATWNAVTYPLWAGFVNDWPQSYVISSDATVTLQCTDGFAILALGKLPESLYASTVEGDSPIIWWRLGESAGTTATDSSGNNNDGTYVGHAATATTGLIVGGSDGALASDGVVDGVSIFYPTLPTPFTVEFWVMYNLADNPGECWLLQIFEDTGENMYSIMTESPNLLQWTWQAGNLGSGILHQEPGDHTGQLLHVALTTDGSTAIAYLNGVNLDSVALPSAEAASYIRIATATNFHTPLKGTFDEFAVYASALSAGTLLNHYNAGAAPYDGDDTGARIGHILDSVSWPAGDRTLDTGVSVLGPAIFQRRQALEAAQEVEKTEQGQLFMGADGTVVFRNRQWRLLNTKATASQATFGDSGTELRYADIVTDGGASYIRNHITVQNIGGALVDITDPTSITSYYERTDDSCVGIIGTSDLEAADLANYRLHKLKDPVQRVTQLTVNPRRDPTNLWPVALGADIGYRYTVNRRPQGVGSALTYTVLAEGISHTFDAQGNWATTLSMSATDTQAYLILDDTTYGILDTARLGF